MFLLFIYRVILHDNGSLVPSTISAKEYCEEMFYGCISLIDATSLASETLVDECYKYTFQGCTNLKLINVSFKEWAMKVKH